jgi:hypothetical protein
LRCERTDGSGLNHVADGESLDGLVLGSAAGAVGAAHGLDVAAAVLVATAVKLLAYLILSLLARHKNCCRIDWPLFYLRLDRCDMGPRMYS